MIIGRSKVKKLIRGPLITRSGPEGSFEGSGRAKITINRTEGAIERRPITRWRRCLCCGFAPEGRGRARQLPYPPLIQPRTLFSWPTSHHNPTTPSLYYIKVKIPLDLAANRFDLAPPPPPPRPPFFLFAADLSCPRFVQGDSWYAKTRPRKAKKLSDFSHPRFIQSDSDLIE